MCAYDALSMGGDKWQCVLTIGGGSTRGGICFRMCSMDGTG